MNFSSKAKVFLVILNNFSLLQIFLGQILLLLCK